MSGALDGIRVLDFSHSPGGWAATMHLADHGAEVVCIEPGTMAARHHDPAYIVMHRNKTRVVLDVATAAGLRQARALIATADVTVFDQRPGELERLGLDAVTLRAGRPELVHAWLPGYGTKGRWTQLPTEDSLIQAITGCAFKQATYADQPMWMIAPQLIYGQGTLGAGAIATALYERLRSGEGQEVIVSGLHAYSGAMAGATRGTGVLRLGGSSGSRGGAPNYRLYQCGDGEWLFLATLTPPFFLRALDVMDATELLVTEGVEGDVMNMLRPPVNAIIIAELERRFMERTRDEWLHLLGDAGVPSGPVGRRGDWFQSETVAANGMRVELKHAELGTVAIPGVPVIFAETPGSVRRLVAEAEPAGLPAHAPARPTATGDRVPAGQGPLHGITVLDFGQVIAGTYPGSILANYGADVIKVESPEGDIFRPYGLGFVGYNHGKRGIVLDLKREEGREALHDLVRRADVVLDNFRSGVTQRLGLDHATLAAINPRIITLSITGYGPNGPLREKPGFDPLLQALSGIMAHQGGADEPVFHTLPVNDVASAMTAVFATAAALLARERTGHGQHGDLSLANISVMCQAAEISEIPGRVPAAEGRVDCLGVSALRRYYPCADGWLGMALTTAEQFHGLCNALEQTIWAARYLADDALTAPVDGELAQAIAAVLAGMPVSDALDRLLSSGVPAAPALRDPELYDDPYLRANGMWEDFEHAQFGTVTAVARFADFGRTPSGFRRRVPELGEHTVEVLREHGFAEERIAALLESGAARQYVPRA